MRFWDTSALVPLLLKESTASPAETLLREDPDPALWWGSAVECTSALTRNMREGRLSEEGFQMCLAVLQALRAVGLKVGPSDELRGRAMRLLTAHPLRAGDALQLAAAVIWCRGNPAGFGFVCFDQRLREAAQREGFEVLPGAV